MPIYLNSRYSTAVVDYLSLTTENVGIPTIFHSPSSAGTVSYTEYSWKDGDRIDHVAFEFYNFPTRWWVIADANPKITDWHSVPAGTLVKIPHV